MTQYAYCDYCKKQVESTTRKPIETFAKVIWVIIIIATLGIGALIFAIYYFNRPKNHCDTCLKKVKYSSEPFKKKEEDLEPLTPKERVMKKAGKEVDRKEKVKEEVIEEVEEEIKERDSFCPYCGEDIKPGTTKCPYCHTSLKTL